MDKATTFNELGGRQSTADCLRHRWNSIQKIESEESLSVEEEEEEEEESFEGAISFDCHCVTTVLRLIGPILTHRSGGETKNEEVSQGQGQEQEEGL